MIPAGIAALRRAIEAEMTDTVRLEVPAPGGTYDPDTLEWTPAGAPDVLWEGPAIIGVTAGTVQTEAGVPVVVYSGTVRLPLDAPRPPVGAAAVVTASTTNDDLPGRRFVIGDAHDPSWRASRLYPATERAQ